MMIASLAESGGAEMLVRNLALDYVRRGHACHIVYISNATDLAASHYYERAFKAELDQAGITYTELGHGCRRNLLLGGWRLRRAVKRFAADVVHIHLGYGLLFQAFGLLRAPTVYTNHNIIFRFPTWLLPIFDRFVDRYIAICGACEVLLRGHVRGPITLIYNGVPADFSAPRVRHAAAHDPLILSVGNLTPQKDYPTLIAAAARIVPALAAQGRSVRFAIAGSGGERPALERQIRDAGLDDRITLLGTRRDVATLMADADLLVLSSLWEGLPITLIEAAMSALPAVATDVGGNSDVVVDGVTGALVPASAPDRIADAVVDLLSDDARYAACSAAMRQRGRSFSLEACADAHLRVYADLVAG